MRSLRREPKYRFVWRGDEDALIEAEARARQVMREVEYQDARARQADRVRRCLAAGGHVFIGQLHGTGFGRCQVCGHTIRDDGDYYDHLSVPEVADDLDARDHRPLMWADVPVAEQNPRRWI